MKAVTFSTYGQPDEVCACTIVPDVGAPRSGEVVIKIIASAINPADLAMIKHVYPGPKPPAQLGIEGAGRIVEIGAGVNTLAVGNHVLSRPRQLGRASTTASQPCDQNSEGTVVS